MKIRETLHTKLLDYITESKKNVCENINITQEIISEVNKFNTPEELLRSGGISIEALDRAAYGFSDEDIKTLMPNELKVKWKDDLENVKYEIQHLQKKIRSISLKQTMFMWAKKVNLTEPIDVSYEKDSFYIEDGHHRYFAAKLLKKPLNINLEIKSNPIVKMCPSLSYDEFHIYIFNKVKSITDSKKQLNEYNQNYTQNFIKWFGDSKITKAGKPMICYHGSSNGDIESFDINMIGNNSGNYGHYGYGIYFSTDIREAKTYGDKIYKCYIKISNPFVGNNKQILQLKAKGITGIDELVPKSIDFKKLKKSFIKNDLIYGFLSNYEKYGIETAWDIIRKENENKIDYDKINDISNIIEYTTLNKNVDGVPQYILDDLDNMGIKPKINYDFPYHQSLHWITDLGKNSREVTETIKSMGYDGVFYGSEIVIFNPNQIKSINNDGSWDTKDNNIYS